MRVAINGFGRIGRLYFRAIFEASREGKINVAAVNDLQNIDCALHLLRHDSVHGAFAADVKKISDSEFSVNGHVIKYLSERDPSCLPWKEMDIDLVAECTGVFRSREQSFQHVSAGAKKVLISCPSKTADKTVIFGVNHTDLSPDDVIISNGSCTTNCLAPIVKILQENFGIVSGHLLTIHSYTGDQRIVDLSHKDLRRARAAGINMIPTSTGATSTIETIFPELTGKLSGLSVRVPTPNVSMIDFTFSVKNKIDTDSLKKIIKQYADSSLKNILGYTEEELVSSDFNRTPLSAAVDLQLTGAIDDHNGHVVAWYDNEWGFSNRMSDVSLLLQS